MIESVEIRNESDRSLWVKACRSEVTNILYIHFGTEKKQIHGTPHKVLPHDYEIIKVDKVRG